MYHSVSFAVTSERTCSFDVPELDGCDVSGKVRAEIGLESPHPFRVKLRDSSMFILIFLRSEDGRQRIRGGTSPPLFPRKLRCHDHAHKPFWPLVVAPLSDLLSPIEAVGIYVDCIYANRKLGMRWELRLQTLRDTDSGILYSSHKEHPNFRSDFPTRSTNFRSDSTFPTCDNILKSKGTEAFQC